MLISMAHAAGEVGTAAPAAADTFWMNMGLIGVMFVLFYLLLIRPQQKRLKEQRQMLDTLQKGDAVVTSGGLVGTVSKIMSDTEVEINLGEVKVVALRYTIQMKVDEKGAPAAAKPEAKSKPAATTKAVMKEKSAPAKKAAAKKAPAKKATPKKTAAKKAPAKKK
jgi:preprotein translocase subunit YajC